MPESSSQAWHIEEVPWQLGLHSETFSPKKQTKIKFLKVSQNNLNQRKKSTLKSKTLIKEIKAIRKWTIISHSHGSAKLIWK